jgi:type II secretory pathway pseudopilin PulG
MIGMRTFQRGFTVLELVMAMMVGLFILAAVATAVVSGQRSSAGIDRKVATSQDVRTALDLMAAEIRMASYNYLGSAAGNIWLNPNDCSTSANQNYKGLQAVSGANLVVEMDLDESGTCGNGDNEIVVFSYDQANFRITRDWVTCSAGRSVDGGLAGGDYERSRTVLGPNTVDPDSRTVRVINGAVPVFRYYDGTGAAIDYAMLPNATQKIRRIEIVLLVESQDVDPNTGLRKQIAYSTSVIPRNHGIQF